MSITLNQHKESITKRIIAKFSDMQTPKMGLSGFFPSVTTSDKMLSIEVERNRQLVAADVQRGTDATLNTFDKYSEKIYIPPFYQEGFNFVDLDRYNVTFGNNNSPTQSDAMNMIVEADKRLRALKNKVERAIEKQRAEALQTGIVTLVNGDNIDYKRQANSIVALTAGNRWNEGTSSPMGALGTGGRFLREEGLSAGSTINVILGRDAFAAFMANDEVKAEADIRRIERINIGFPQLNNVTGLSFHGQISTFDFIINLWTYNDFYEEANGTKVPYIDPKNVIMVAEDFVANTGFAGVPAIIRDMNNAEYPEYISQVESEFYVNNYIDPRKKAHMFEICSAPLAVPVSIDRIYTMQVLA